MTPILVLGEVDGELEEKSERFFHVAPLFVQTEMMGPEDLLLPPRLLGFRCAAALGNSITVAETSFCERIGVLPKKWIERVSRIDAALTSGQGEPIEGWPQAPVFLDERDPRLEFHEEISRELLPIQEFALSRLSQEAQSGSSASPVGPKLIPFPFATRGELGFDAGTTEYAFAAASSNRAGMGGASETVEYQVGEEGHSLRFRVEQDGKNVSLNVFDTYGNPSDLLDGASIRSASGSEIGRIKDSQARLPIDSLASGFRVEDSSGGEIPLVEAGE